MGWPQYTAAALPGDANIAVVNRGIAGNRVRLDAPRSTPSWGRAGLSKFDDDVLGTDGVTHVVIAYNSNDWGLPGRVTGINEMPTSSHMIGAYDELVDRSLAAGLSVILGTTTPLAPDLVGDPERERIRSDLNGWIRTSGHLFVDFDAAIRSPENPSRVNPIYAAPDHTHPNIDGQKRLAKAMVDVIAQLEM
jgi:lysophospholipase L1-like esterase